MVSLELFKKSLPSLLSGLGVTIKIAFFAIIIACVLGLIFGILSISKYKIIRGIAFIYTTIIRGTPLMIQAMFIFFGLGQFLGIRFNPVSAGIWILALNSGAYLSEIFRGGIQAVDIGQMEAARSLGMPASMAMRKVILPQAIKIMVPSLMNQFIIAIKDTSILSVISIRELMQSGQIIVGTTYKAFEIYGIVAIMYLVLITLLMWVSKLVERRLAS